MPSGPGGGHQQRSDGQLAHHVVEMHDVRRRRAYPMHELATGPRIPQVERLRGAGVTHLPGEYVDLVAGPR